MLSHKYLVLAQRTKAANEARFRASRHAERTAAAWVAAIRVKVLELVHEAGVLDNILGHPDKTSTALALRCSLDEAGMGKFICAVYALEEVLDELLAGDAEPSAPNLARACWEAGEASDKWLQAVQAEREEETASPAAS